jgi:hypothetical protein
MLEPGGAASGIGTAGRVKILVDNPTRLYWNDEAKR